MHARHRSPFAALTTAILVGSSTLFASSTHGVTLGAESVESALGQPLVASFRLRGAPEALADATCFRLATSAASDGLPQITQGTLTLERRQGDPWLVLRSARPVNDPAVRVSLVATCDGTSRRDYVLLLDPPLMVVGPGRSGVVERARPPAAEPSVTQAPALSAPDQPAATAAATVATTPDTAARAQRTPQRPGGESGTARTRATQAATSSSAASRPRAATGDRDRLRIDQPARSLHSIDDAALAALAIPRLRLTPEISFDVGGAAQPAGNSALANDPLQRAIADARRARLRDAPIEEDLPPRLEADFVVAKRKIEELQAQLAAQTAAAAKPAAPAETPPRAASTTALNADHWLSTWLPALIGGAAVLLLLLGLLWSRRRRAAVSDPFMVAADDIDARDAAATVVEPTPPAPPPPAPPAPRAAPSVEPPDELPAPVAAETSAPAQTSAIVDEQRPNADVLTLAPVVPQGGVSAGTLGSARPDAAAAPSSTTSAFQANASDVDVQELSHVTEEAQVYVEVGRIDQAIALLKSHVETHEGARPSPAPWLMLLDLYRRTGNRDAYDELAPRFQQRFNGRMPAWDNYGHELALDDGLEAFPHLVSRISREWRTQRARDLLEELLYDNRGGSRLGFSLAAYRDILLLMQIHDAVTQTGVEPTTTLDAAGANPDDGTPTWTLDLDTVDSVGDSKLGQWLDRPKGD